MIRCSRCIYPNSKPDLFLDAEGVCSACRAFERRALVDWEARRLELADLVGGRHVIVPVSGGKDSTYQVITLKQLGARVTAVNAATDYLTPIGRRNLDNLKRLCDLIEWTPNVTVRRKIARIGLFEVGDMSWGEHCVIWGIPFRAAAARRRSRGRCRAQPQNEYGGPVGADRAQVLDRRWREEFGGMLGLRPSDLVGRDGLTAEDLGPYTMPAADAKVRAVWLGHYLPWNGAANAIVAGCYGFESYPFAVEGSIGNFEDLDNFVTGPRDYLKFVKYAFGRATDIACNLIRRGWLSRDDALRIVRMRERFPSTYLGRPLADILAPFDITVDDFVQVCDHFTNRTLFRARDSGLAVNAEGLVRPVLRADDELIKDRDGTPILRDEAV